MYVAYIFEQSSKYDLTFTKTFSNYNMGYFNVDTLQDNNHAKNKQIRSIQIQVMI
jgi:hypothetical protein